MIVGGTSIVDKWSGINRLELTCGSVKRERRCWRRHRHGEDIRGIKVSGGHCIKDCVRNRIIKKSYGGSQISKCRPVTCMKKKHNVLKQKIKDNDLIFLVRINHPL